MSTRGAVFRLCLLFQLFSEISRAGVCEPAVYEVAGLPPFFQRLLDARVRASSAPRKPMTTQDHSQIYYYTTSNGLFNPLLYQKWNNPSATELWLGESPVNLERVLGWNLELVTALAKLPDFRENPTDATSITYRGVELNVEDARARYQAGSTIVEPGFLGTSKLTGKAFRRGNVHFTIQGKSGKDISSHSKYPAEQEVLFSPLSKFRVLRYDERPGSNVINIKLEEIE